jgi:hypothetical protein
MLAHSPRAFPWEQDLPWALARLREITAVGLERAGRASEAACVRDAVASTKRGAGTSATVRSRTACGRFAAGRRPGARPNVAGMTMSEPSTPRRRRSAVNEPKLCPRLMKTPRLRPRMVTQLNLFFASSLRSARLPRTPRDLGPQPGTLLLTHTSVMSKTVNVSGLFAAPWMALRSDSSSTRRLAATVLYSKAASRTRYRYERLQIEDVSRTRRSSIIA